MVERKEKQHAERLDQQQSVVIEKDGHDHLFSIEWRQVEHPPCDPEKIQHIKTDGTTWLIVDNDDRLYRSLDREHWHTVRLSASEDSPRISKLDIVSGMWIAVAGYSKLETEPLPGRTWLRIHPHRRSLLLQRPLALALQGEQGILLH